MKIYNSPNIHDVYIKLYKNDDEIFFQEEHHSARLREIHSLCQEFQPVFFYQEYNILNPVYVAVVQNKFYKIRINKGNYKYIAIDDKHKFNAIRILKVFESFEILTNNSQVKSAPDENAGHINASLVEFIEFGKNPEWIKVKSIEDLWLDEESDPNYEVKEGWVRWRNKDKILIHFRLLP
ncbi:hypothetical protein HNQ88_004682 [Aureibacter tunicatorum]|uniref:Uncharacterized protein n=1 Tax=Aureibacter tunicatorum TaxID=866807 RepID=A0AAE3XS91_9BACT|nr:hypothetical protein [Aureibacter tunicatorum]